MMTYQDPMLPQSSILTVSQVCKILTISRESLRRYEHAGLIESKTDQLTGRKFYTGKSVNRLWYLARGGFRYNLTAARLRYLSDLEINRRHRQYREAGGNDPVI